jgi:hypothetical protein
MLATWPPGRTREAASSNVAEAASQPGEDLRRILPAVVDRDVSAELLSRVEPAVRQVDGHHMRRAVQPAAHDRRQTDGAGADYCYDVARLDVSIQDADLVASGQDIGHHEQRLVADPGWGRIGRGVGEGNPDIFSLGPVDLVSENPSAPAQALPVSGLAAVAAGTTRTDARHQDPVARLDVLYRRTDRLHGTDGLMPEYPTVGHDRDITLEDVQVGATYGDGVDSNDGIGVCLQNRHGDFFPSLASRTVVYERLHSEPPIDVQLLWRQP